MQSSNKKEHIVIVDDHPVVLDGIKLLLHDIRPDAELTAVSNGADAYAVFDSAKFVDWLFVDLNLPDINGLELVKKIKQEQAERRNNDTFNCKVVVLSSELDAQTIDQALSQGVNGVLSKAATAVMYEDCLMTIDLARLYLSQKHTSQLKYYRDGLMLELKNIKQGLSGRMFETLVMLSNGYSNKTISQKMGISENTVKSHVSSLMSLFNAKNRTYCVTQARELKII